MIDLDEFAVYYKLAYELIRGSTKAQVAEVARVLALNVAHHQAEHGEIPFANFADRMRPRHAVGSLFQ